MDMGEALHSNASEIAMASAHDLYTCAVPHVLYTSNTNGISATDLDV